MDNLIRFGGLYPPIAVRADCGAPTAGRDPGLRGRGDDGPRPRRHLHDDGPQGQEGRAHQEPEHHQERLVAGPGGGRHRAHAADERHDPRRRRDRRVPLRRRLVRQAGDAGRADEQPLGAVAAPRPQARPGLPPPGDLAGERHRRRDLHPEQGVPAPAGGHREVQGDRGPLPLPGLDPADGELPGRDHLHRRDGREAPRAGRRLPDGARSRSAAGPTPTSGPPP